MGHPCSPSFSHWIHPVKVEDPQAKVGGCMVGLHQAGSCAQLWLCRTGCDGPFWGAAPCSQLGACGEGCANSLQEWGRAIRGDLSGGLDCGAEPCTPLQVGFRPSIAIGEQCTGAGQLLFDGSNPAAWDHTAFPCVNPLCTKQVVELLSSCWLISGGLRDTGGVRKAPKTQRPSPCS